MSRLVSRGHDEPRKRDHTRPCRVLLVGPPGAGKSTQGIALAERLGAAYLSTGELLREEVQRGSPLGQHAAADMRAGRLVPDWLISFALERSLSDAMRSGFVLDGYPRTLDQARTFARLLGGTRLDGVIELDVPDDVAMFRLARRLRGDDDARTACVRLETYRSETGPMIEYFAATGLVTTLDGTGPPEAVAMALYQLIGTETRRTSSWA
jgi:adenylate kinase